jgi:hypothetical protein
VKNSKKQRNSHDPIFGRGTQAVVPEAVRSAQNPA